MNSTLNAALAGFSTSLRECGAVLMSQWVEKAESLSLKSSIFGHALLYSCVMQSWAPTDVVYSSSMIIRSYFIISVTHNRDVHQMINSNQLFFRSEYSGEKLLIKSKLRLIKSHWTSCTFLIENTHCKYDIEVLFTEGLQSFFAFYFCFWVLNHDPSHYVAARESESGSAYACPQPVSKTGLCRDSEQHLCWMLLSIPLPLIYLFIFFCCTN